MNLKELFPFIKQSAVEIYEKRKYKPSRFILSINPKTNKGCISDDLLDREIYSISVAYGGRFIIYVCNNKDDEELVKKAISIGLIEDVSKDDSSKEDDF